MSDTSTSLMGRLQHNPTEAEWQRLSDVYTPLLRQWLRQYRLQEQDQDDLVQDVWKALVIELPRFKYDPKKGSFRGWLWTILTNRLKCFWSTRDKRPGEFVEDPEDSHARLSGIWNQLHDQFVLDRLLDLVQPEFEPKTWTAFRRLTRDGAAPVDVATELGMTLGAVYVAKSKVMKRLREEAMGLID